MKDLPELTQFHDFKEDIIVPLNIEPYRTEWRIAAIDYSIAGLVDFVGKLPDNTFVLMDWKRSKKLPDNMENNYGKKAL